MKRNKETNRIKVLNSKELTKKFTEIMSHGINHINKTYYSSFAAVCFQSVKNGIIMFEEIVNIEFNAYSRMDSLFEELQNENHFMMVSDCTLINEDFLLSNVNSIRLAGPMILISIPDSMLFIDESVSSYPDIINILSTKLPELKVNILINRYMGYYQELEQTTHHLKECMNNIDQEANKLSNEDRLKYEFGKSGSISKGII